MNAVPTVHFHKSSSHPSLEDMMPRYCHKTFWADRLSRARPMCRFRGCLDSDTRDLTPMQGQLAR
jgi:hypothetical protein